MRETARVLWMTYVGLSLAASLGPMLLARNGFEAVCRTLATLATGGFSTRIRSPSPAAAVPIGCPFARRRGCPSEPPGRERGSSPLGLGRFRRQQWSDSFP